MSAAPLPDPEQLGRFVGEMFAYADEGTFVSLRAFHERDKHKPPVLIRAVAINGAGLDPLVKAAVGAAGKAARHPEPAVFCPPVATFLDPKHAGEADLANGVALSVELDVRAGEALAKVTGLLGKSRFVVASGGTWTDPATGEVQPKLHVHYRLNEPTRSAEEHALLKRARWLGTKLVGGDATNVPAVHPIRWPGSVHRKGEPRLCRIVEHDDVPDLDLRDALERLEEAAAAAGIGQRSEEAPGDGTNGPDMAELIRQLQDGTAMHDPLVRLAARYVGAGMPERQVVDTLRGLMEAVPPEKRGEAGRWEGHCRDIPRTVRTAVEKYSPARNAGDREGKRPAAAETPYTRTPSGIVWHKPTEGGSVPKQLTTFDAVITAELERDDGAERTMLFEIDATCHGRARRFTVPAAEFAGLGWVPRELGAQAVVMPGSTLRDHARAAIQLLSGQPTRRAIYAHTGWRQLDGKPLYLHAGGGIGAGGAAQEVETELTGALALFALPEPPAGARRVRAIRAHVAMLDLGPASVVTPVVAAIWRATLGPADFALYLAGPTGVFKSQVAALAQQHWGATMDSAHLPGTWLSTGNNLETLAFAAKDALLVVDDFAPSGPADDVRRLHREAARLLRAQGNNAGRGRLRPDGTPRPPKPPRGLILSTGEEFPSGQSVRARCLFVEVSKTDIDPAQLAERQADAAAGLYAEAMAAWLQWLAADLDGRLARFRTRRDALRQEGADAGSHRRTPWIVADLLAALELFLAFAVEAGALSEAEAAAILARCGEALRTVAAGQAEHQNAENPTRRFFELLGAALAGKEAHLARADRPEEAPGDAVADGWGWLGKRVRLARSDDDPEAGERLVWTPQGRRIGWAKGETIYLEPDAAYAVVQEVARKQGTSLPLQPRTLWKRLAEAQLLVATDTGKNTVNATIGNARRRTVAISAPYLLGKRGQWGQWGREAAKPLETNEPPPDFPPPFPSEASKMGAENGGSTAKNGGSAVGPLDRCPHSAPPFLEVPPFSEAPDRAQSLDSAEPRPQSPHCPHSGAIKTPKISGTQGDGAHAWVEGDL